ncbi:AAA family ATPase [Fusobacterium ulcerans]|uniref:AAA family ATPase n=1 Tax=Fusobacterium ulcerans TaxID=861 RepID=UPI001D0A52CC|nr:AAA family ATPase [Fusobacterium ulcerans]MCB8565791.1 AAA family ATPase [Fusobacterium ulcerans]MCB8650642.1 AAA family ATPase [Fusobacterium ulcerans]
MKIEKLRIKNFRCYENIELELKENYTVLVGINGAGKTTILDAISIALGGYISNFDGMGIYAINKSDSHYKMYELGSRIEREHQFPVEISVIGKIEKENIKWYRALNKENGRTSNFGAKEIIAYATNIQEKVKAGNKEILLPVIAYYGTGRLWMQKREKSNKNSKENFSRLKGYVDCLDSASNEKLMLKWFEKITYLELQEAEKIPELEAVKRALNKSYEIIDEGVDKANFNYKVKSGELEVSIKRKNGTVESLPLRTLSDGIKSTMSMIADIAYRMAVLNPQLLDNILLQTSGIVLIDEIDMHLHPSWQSKIIKVLTETFPKVQFIFTTHSPSVISNILNENILVLNNLEIYKLNDKTYGRDIESIVREVMRTEVRPQEIVKKLKEFNKLLDDGKIEDARKLLKSLEEILGQNDTNIIDARISLELEEIGV